MQEFIENGTFMSKYSWKRIIKVKMSSLSRDELLLKANDSVSLSRFLDIHNSSEPYLLYKIIKETPRIYKYGKLAVSLLGFMFSGNYIMACRSCGDVTNKLTEHAILFCKENDNFRTKLWQSLIHSFGTGFFNTFIALSPADQVDSLFSGCYNILQDEDETKYCLRLFVASLCRMHFKNSIQL